ncbi:galactose mutarotase [Spirosoma arcticum]
MPATVGEVQSYTLQNQAGTRISLTNFGATITGIWVPDRQGNRENVVLSYLDLASYQDDPYYIGCTVGRYANRIDRGLLLLGDDLLQLTINEEKLTNHLHGGFAGFNKKTWSAVETVNTHQPERCLAYTSPHGEEGYPGNLSVTIHYSLTEQNELIVAYVARTDRPTVVSLTNHSYFNLSGGKQDVRQHILTMAASTYTPLNERHLPLEPVPVDGSLFDLRKGRELGPVVESNPTLHYCLDTNACLCQAATLYDPDSGRRLTVYTTAPGLQVYSGQFLAAPFGPFAGVCLEPQHYPDAPNHPNFPSALLEPEEVYRQTTVYQFDVV